MSVQDHRTVTKEGGDKLTPIRLLLVDSRTLVRAALRMLLERDPSLVVVGEGPASAEMITLAIQEKPDVILLAVMPIEERGITLLAPFLAAIPQARIIVLGAARNVDQHRQAIRTGAVGIVLQEQTPEVLVKAITKVHEGEVWIDRTMMASVFTEMTQSIPTEGQGLDPRRLASLTERELEVIGLICEGLSNRQMAQRLQISETTIRHHLTSIFSKLECASRLELVIYAYHNGLAKLPGKERLDLYSRIKP